MPPAMAEPAAKPRRVLLGHISSAHGIQGDVLIKTHTASPESISAYGPLSDASGGRLFEIRIVRVTSKGVVARIKGVADRTAAEALRGVELFAERSQLPETGEHEYYHSDLVGLTAVDGEGRMVGEVIAVQNFGAGDLVEIRLTGSRASELIPFTDAFVPDVDIAGGKIVVSMPLEAEDD